jgi:hypothetical protein
MRVLLNSLSFVRVASKSAPIDCRRIRTSFYKLAETLTLSSLKQVRAIRSQTIHDILIEIEDILCCKL